MPAHTRLILPRIAERLRDPVDWTHAYDLSDDVDRRRVYLLQGKVTYAPETMTGGQVWFSQRGGDTAASGEIALSGDAYKTGVQRIPLGTVQIAGRRFVFVEARFYESVAIEIHEWPPDGARPTRVLQKPGGGC